MNPNIEYIFSADGPLKIIKNDYIPRPSQIEAAKRLWDAFAQDKHFILEGPCGFGKTLSYLVPLIEELRQKPNKVAVIVTNGISLQEQLFYKDLPLIFKLFAEDLDEDFTFALLKGKQNFICMEKMAEDSGFLDSKEDQENMKKIRKWYQKTETGDFSELNFIPSPKLLSNIACTKEGECKGRKCKVYSDCFYAKSKQKADSARIIITNYHMLFSDLKTGGKILPPHEIIIFDEAHEMGNIYRDFQEHKVSLSSMTVLRNDFSEVFNKIDDYDKDFRKSYENRLDMKGFLDNSEKYFDSILDNHFYKAPAYELTKVFDERTTLISSIDLIPDIKRISDTLIDMSEEISNRGEVLYHTRDEGDEELDAYNAALQKLENMSEKVSEMMNMLGNYSVITKDDGMVFWVERAKGYDGKFRVSINSKPVYVGESLHLNFFNEPSVSCILTSATLSVNGSFEYIKDQVGLSLCEQERVEEFIGESPFNLTEQQLWYLPQDAIDGDNSNKVVFENKLPVQVSNIISACGGGVLALFTSYNNMRVAHENLMLDGRSYKILKQGDKPRTQLIEEFKNDEDSVLLGTKSFFTGIDVPGNSLRCVIIDKFPFPNPSDPIMQKLQANEQAKCFNKYFIPEMIITLKQAIGRGVRSIDDKCVVCVLDNRLATARYKTKVANSFNYPKTATRSLEDVESFIEGTFKKE